MSRIIDNEDLDLIDVLKQHLPHSSQLDACVGYFNLRAWASLRPELQSMLNNEDIDESPERVRLLVGMAVSGADQVKSSLAILKDPNAVTDKRRAHEKAKSSVKQFAQQLTWGMPTEADRQAVLDLLSDLKSGFLRVSFAGRTALHAKLYVCHLAGAVENYRAVVGSSNFTSSGLSHQGELNLEESDVQLGKDFHDWFMSKWDDVFTFDITDDLIEVLENSWAALGQQSPRLMHLKLAYELSRDARAGKNLEIPSKIADELMPWQESAVKVATRMLQSKGLAIVGDVVGLGKTLTGTAIAAAYGERVLIICPKNLEKMWQGYLDDYDILGKVVPLSMATRVLPELKPYKLVIVDESHNLRHTTHTAAKALRTYIDSCDAKVLLLTATMFNASHLDISGQLRLKLNDDDDLGIRPEEHIRALGENGEWLLAEKTNGRLSNLAAFDQSTFSTDWQRLLGQFLIRRTRGYLKETYGEPDKKNGRVFFKFKDGTPFSFPDRIPMPLKYQGGEADPGDRMASANTFDQLEKMKFARYQPGRYVKSDTKADSDAKKNLLNDMQRANSTAGFIKTTVLKRLASSPKAFFITVEKMLLRGHVLQFALDAGLDVPIGTLDDNAYDTSSFSDSDLDDFDDSALSTGNPYRGVGSWAKGLSSEEWTSLAKDNYAKLKAENPRGLRWAPSVWFDTASFSQSVSSDNATLQTIVNEFGDWDPANDSKITALAELVNSLSKGEKLLVFSEYKDTIDYVYQNLQHLCPEIEIGAVSGSSDDPTYMARRFSPISNENLGGLPAGTSELQVLLATDVLSEGQNLQDCAAVLNWDLPWTIIRIIQRAGRVDRIGQKAESIKVLSFMPHEGVDDRITLIKRLAGRLETNEALFGGGERFFGGDPNDETGWVEAYFNGTVNLNDDEGEVDFGSYALGIWDGATQTERDLAIAIPSGSTTTRQTTEVRQKTLVHAKVTQEDQSPIDFLAAMLDSGAITTLTHMEALKLTAAEAYEQPISENKSHLDSLAEIVVQAIAPQANQTKILLNHGIRKTLHDFLTDYPEKSSLAEATQKTLDEIATALLQSPLYRGGEERARELNRARRKFGDLYALEGLIELYNNGELLDESGQNVPELEVVLSFGFRNEE